LAFIGACLILRWRWVEELMFVELSFLQLWVRAVSGLVALGPLAVSFATPVSEPADRFAVPIDLRDSGTAANSTFDPTAGTQTANVCFVRRSCLVSTTPCFTETVRKPQSHAPVFIPVVGTFHTAQMLTRTRYAVCNHLPYNQQNYPDDIVHEARVVGDLGIGSGDKKSPGIAMDYSQTEVGMASSTFPLGRLGDTADFPGLLERRTFFGFMFELPQPIRN
jgi:hypothetical protein